MCSGREERNARAFSPSARCSRVVRVALRSSARGLHGSFVQLNSLASQEDPRFFRRASAFIAASNSSAFSLALLGVRVDCGTALFAAYSRTTGRGR